MKQIFDRLVTLLAGAFAILIVSFPSLAMSDTPKDRCEKVKLKARAAYTKCLTRKILKARKQGTAEDFTKCDKEYVRRFEKAQSIADCQPLDQTATMALIKQQTLAATQQCTASTSPCGALSVSSESNTGQVTVRCQLLTSACAATVGAAFDQAKAKFPELEFGTNPVTWIQAWGAAGADGEGSDCKGSGGASGYAQLVTTPTGFSEEFYYYLGESGGHAGDSGGQGGAATLVTNVDLTQMADQAPQEKDLVLVAGGGGGRGGDDSAFDCAGQENDTSGGAGGTAISGTGGQGTGAGGDGKGGGGSGAAGTNGAPGGSGGTGGASDGGTGTSGLGGRGGENGKNNLGNTGWSNSPVELTFTAGTGGRGGDTTASGEICEVGGGGGGGGYGGGGGGVANFNNNCSGGGGGGASFAIESDLTDNCAPTTAPTNPGPHSDGFVQISFSLNPNVCQ